MRGSAQTGFGSWVSQHARFGNRADWPRRGKPHALARPAAAGAEIAGAAACQCWMLQHAPGLCEALTAIGVHAALAIREAASKGGVQRKADGSPVTAADMAAEAAIRDGLARLAPALPIVSEEQAEHAAAASAAAAIFWSTRSTARANSSPAATNTRSTSR